MSKAQKAIAYTDGACSGNPGPGGWATILIRSDLTVQELGGREAHTTNNRMELIATIEAIRSTPTSTPILIHTDSTYVIQGVKVWSKSWEKKGWKTAQGKPVANQDLWIELTSLARTHRVEWQHVKGHSGVIGNDRADELAVAFSLNKKPSLFEGPLEESPVSKLRALHFP